MRDVLQRFNKMQINDFLYVSLILEILYLSSTNGSNLMILCKKSPPPPVSDRVKT